MSFFDSCQQQLIKMLDNFIRHKNVCKTNYIFYKFSLTNRRVITKSDTSQSNLWNVRVTCRLPQSSFLTNSSINTPVFSKSSDKPNKNNCQYPRTLSLQEFQRKVNTIEEFNHNVADLWQCVLSIRLHLLLIILIWLIWHGASEFSWRNGPFSATICLCGGSTIVITKYKSRRLTHAHINIYINYLLYDNSFGDIVTVWCNCCVYFSIFQSDDVSTPYLNWIV